MMRNKNAKPRVAASKIGAACYCPYGLYLARTGARVSRDNIRMRQYGVADHRKWTAKKKKLSSTPGWAVLLSIVVLLMAILWLF